MILYIIDKLCYGLSCNLKKHTLVSFFKDSNCTCPSNSCNFDRLRKTHSCMFTPNEKPYYYGYKSYTVCIKKGQHLTFMNIRFVLQ